MPHPRALLLGLAACSALAASLALASCGSSQTNNLAPPPRPPDPAQLTLNPIRVTRASWAQAGASAVAAAPTGRRRPAAPAMSAEVAQPILVGANEAVRACYRGLLAFSPQASGTISMLMRVTTEGSVADVEPVGNTDPSLLLMMPCVLNAVRTRRFPPTRAQSLMSFPFTLRSGEVGAPGQPGVGAPVEVARPRPGEIPVPNPETISVRPWRPTLVPNTNPVRALTRDMAAEAAPDITSLVDTCYAAATVMVPGLNGQFGLRIAVEPSGNVSRVEVQDQNSLAGPLRECIVVLGRRLQFHSSGGGAVVSVDIALAQSEGATPGASPTGAGLPSGALIPGAVVGTPTPLGAPTATPQGGLMPMSGTPR